MNFFQWCSAISAWDAERVKNSKFPILKTLHYLYLIGFFGALIYISLSIAYRCGHTDGYHRRFEEERLERNKHEK